MAPLKKHFIITYLIAVYCSYYRPLVAQSRPLAQLSGLLHARSGRYEPIREERLHDECSCNFVALRSGGVCRYMTEPANLSTTSIMLVVDRSFKTHHYINYH